MGTGSWRRRISLTAVAIGLTLVPASAAGAATLKVNSTGDQDDASPGGICATAQGKCTLRAALTSANLGDTIKFSGGVFDGSVSTSTIKTANPLTVSTAVTIKGGNCGGATSPKPCVGIESKPAGHDAIVVQADSVMIDGLAVTRADNGISLPTSSTLTVTNSWFGLRLDGSPAPDGNGVLLGGAVGFTGGDASVIGGDTPRARNLFAGNTTGVQILGGNGNAIEGNWFGVDKHGEPAGGNETNIQIAAVLGSASDNTIGDVAPAATTACDGACNVISGSQGDGIDLTGLSGNGPPVDVGILRNVIGLRPDGKTPLPNQGNGINVGDADSVGIGDGTAEGANVIAANGLSGVDAGSGASSLFIQGNLFGSDTKGKKPLPNTQSDAIVRSAATFTGNRALGNGTLPPRSLEVMGAAAQVSNNTFGLGTDGSAHGFGEAAIRVTGGNDSIGGAPGNVISSGPGTVGVLLDGSDGSRVEGNTFGANGVQQQFGIQIKANGADTASNNAIGKTDQGNPNQIDNSTENAIEITGDDNDQTTVGENHGAGGALGAQGFLDLSPNDGVGVAADGPNHSIAAPTTFLAHCDEIQGSGAVAGATLRVYRTTAGSAGLDQLVSTFTDADGGGFSQVFGDHGATGAYVVNQTSPAGDSSEFSAPITITAGGTCP
jgi:CSLREA domain-containing protein